MAGMIVGYSIPGRPGTVSKQEYDTWKQGQNMRTTLNDQAVTNAQTQSAAAQARNDQGLDFSQHLGEFQQLLGVLPKPGASSSSSTSMSGGAGAGTWTPTPVMPQVQLGAGGIGAPASSSGPAFAKAKDTVAHSLTGLMKAARDNFAGRNLSGGSAEINAMGNILTRGNQQLADVARDQAIKDTDTANDFTKTAYAGGITQRGQDIAARSADADRAAAAARDERSFSQSQSQNNMAAILGLLSAFKSLY